MYHHRYILAYIMQRSHHNTSQNGVKANSKKLNTRMLSIEFAYTTLANDFLSCKWEEMDVT